MTRPLSDLQRDALDLMSAQNIGAVCVGTIYGIRHNGEYDAYAFPQDIRAGTDTATGEDIAFCVLAILHGDSRDAKVLSA